MLSTKLARRSNTSGFGLLETVIAAGLLTTVVGASLALTSAAIRNNVTTSQRTAAYMIAQEGIEAIKNIISTNLVDGNPATAWNDGITDSDYYSVTYNVSLKRWQVFRMVQDIQLDGVAYRRLINIRQNGANVDEKVVTIIVSTLDPSGVPSQPTVTSSALLSNPQI